MGGSPNEILSAILSGDSVEWVEGLYRGYQEDPSSVSSQWQEVFLALGGQKDGVGRKEKEARGWHRAVEKALYGAETEVKSAISSTQLKVAIQDSIRAWMLIRAYRVRGHLSASLDPLKLHPPVNHGDLDPKTYGFETKDMEREIYLGGVLGLEVASIKELLSVLQRLYCGTLAVEYMHIQSLQQREWIQKAIESPPPGFDEEKKGFILEQLLQSENFERFLGLKFIGTKRFGLDGGEATLPALREAIERGAAHEVEEVIIGMAHRGRLNVLTHLLQKPYASIFREFQGHFDADHHALGSGDVKYHLGSSADVKIGQKTVHLSLTANPSHLESVDPVVLGKAKGKSDLRGGRLGYSKVLPILIHGDAAFAGQGVVSECFTLSRLEGYETGGTLHFVINNQIGFTTVPRYGRSSPYCSDVAKMVQAPIFHVGGDDPEAVVRAMALAMDFRQTFQTDVVVDMFCYRRHGHNEADEPLFTQPLMYKAIAKHKSCAVVYSEKLLKEGVVSEESVLESKKLHTEQLEEAFSSAKQYVPTPPDWLDGQWEKFQKAPHNYCYTQTGVSKKKLLSIVQAMNETPQGFDVHPKVKALMEKRLLMLRKGAGIDWATGEALAIGSLLLEGVPVRFSGQDSRRGTFSQRHGVIVHQSTGEDYVPLGSLGARFDLLDSPLSEEAVLGFEYGYSLTRPEVLVIWEAQFGDFANGAQIIFDQFISSGEYKWLRMSGLTLLLPHGYEGQGPEHSSARLERYLQACAEHNLQVVNPSTPANFFHLLRRQVVTNFRKPLVVMTPKSLLRHKGCVSSLKDFTAATRFQRIKMEETPVCSLEEAEKVVLCSGKVYYDLLQRRKQEKKLGRLTYIIRIEQLYPFPLDALVRAGVGKKALKWCQEEPENMGAWRFVERILREEFGSLTYVGRKEAASPATGQRQVHYQEQEAFLKEALS